MLMLVCVGKVGIYDINLEADNSVPSAMKHVSDASVPSASERVSDVKVSASDSSIVQNQNTGNPQTQTVTQMQQTGMSVTAKEWTWNTQDQTHKFFYD